MQSKKGNGIRRRTRGRVDKQIRSHTKRESVPSNLPLVHVTSVWHAREVIKGGKLETAACDVFERQSIYFFVMRPAYRSRLGAQKSHQLSRFPVALILAADGAGTPLHVFPFDTGAAAGGAFANQADPFVPLDDYELDPTHDAAAGHIEWAFGGLTEYFNGQLRNGILDDVPEFESVTRGFVDIARMGREGSNQHDKRASAVEIAIGHDVDIKGNVLYAILPKQFLESAQAENVEFIEMLKSLRIEFDVYDWQPNTKPDDFEEKINQMAFKWYEKEGWV